MILDITSAKKIVDLTYADSKNGNNRILNTDGSVPIVQVKGFIDLKNIHHGFTTRLGGVSKGIYESLNMGLRLDDSREDVIQNYQRLGESMGFDHTRISCPDQVHKSNILVVTEDDAGVGIKTELTHREIDAQITNVPGIPLIVYSADCVPILLADPISRVIASVHAGWRGTVQGIAAKTVQKMIEVYGCLPENIFAVIGPSISMENYEVDRTVIDEIMKCPYIDMSDENTVINDIDGVNVTVLCREGSFLRENVPVDYLGKKLTHPGAPYPLFRTVSIRKKYMLDLWKLNELILVNSGISSGHIYNTRLCTMKYHDLFFSHRYTNGRRGLNAGIIFLS